MSNQVDYHKRYESYGVYDLKCEIWSLNQTLNNVSPVFKDTRKEYELRRDICKDYLTRLENSIFRNVKDLNLATMSFGC